jgi:hypothetical protein
MAQTPQIGIKSLVRVYVLMPGKEPGEDCPNDPGEGLALIIDSSEAAGVVV